MPTFSYTALKNNKDIVSGKIDALDARSAREAIKKMGLLPTKITDDSVKTHGNKSSEVNKKSKKLSNLMEKNFDNWIPKHEKINPNDRFTYVKTTQNSKGKTVKKVVQDYAQSKDANYAVVRTAEDVQKIPSVLWEVAFMISPKGRERMSNPALMNNYSDIMAKSVEQYFG